MEEKKGVFFVGIEDPENIKKNMLDSCSSIANVLERYERFKEVRKNRIESIGKFKRDIKEILRLVSALREKLPNTGLRVNIKKDIGKDQIRKPKADIKKGAKYSDKKSKEKIELESLKAELSDVEAKLNSLI